MFARSANNMNLKVILYNNTCVRVVENCVTDILIFQLILIFEEKYIQSLKYSMTFLIQIYVNSLINDLFQQILKIQ